MTANNDDFVTCCNFHGYDEGRKAYIGVISVDRMPGRDIEFSKEKITELKHRMMARGYEVITFPEALPDGDNDYSIKPFEGHISMALQVRGFYLNQKSFLKHVQWSLRDVKRIFTDYTVPCP
jgi:hypothetical protein